VFQTKVSSDGSRLESYKMRRCDFMNFVAKEICASTKRALGTSELNARGITFDSDD